MYARHQLQVRAYEAARGYLQRVERHRLNTREEARLHTMMAVASLRLQQMLSAESRARRALRLLNRRVVSTERRGGLYVMCQLGYVTVSTFFRKPRTHQLVKRPAVGKSSHAPTRDEEELALRLQAGMVLTAVFAQQGRAASATATALQQLRACERHLGRSGGVISPLLAELATERCAWGLLWTHAIRATRLREHYLRLSLAFRSRLSHPDRSSAMATSFYSQAIVEFAICSPDNAMRHITAAIGFCPRDDALLLVKLLSFRAILCADAGDEASLTESD